MTERKDAIDEIELERIAREFIASSLGGPDSEISAIRERNLRAYNAEPVGEWAPPDIDDRSAFVSSDVADTVDGMLPQLLDVFVSDEKAVECKPKKRAPELAEQAKSATAYLNWLFYDQNEGLNILYEWVQDAGTQKVGFAKVWAEEEAEDSKAHYEGLSEDQLAVLLMDGAELVGDPEVDDRGLLNFTIKNEQKRMAFKVECVSPGEMRVDPNANWNGGLAAIGEVKDKRRFELEEMGYDLDGIGEGSVTTPDGEQLVALGDGAGDLAHELHDSHKLYQYAELYMKLDVDGDGITEWNQLCLINGTLMNVEQVDDHPYEKFCLMPRAHAFFGDCPADRAYGIQKEQTNLSRGLFDNMAFATTQRTYINTRANVNINDLLDNRPGGAVRGEGPPGDAFAPIPTQPIPQTAWQMQEWLNVRLENRTGFTRYSQGMDADSLNKTATGVSIITSKSDMRLRLMTRFVALGLKGVFRKLLKLACKHQHTPQEFEVNGKWFEVSPLEWRDQFNIKINVGLGHGTREQKMQAVMAMLPLQQMGAQMGVVRPEHIASTIRLAAEVNEFKNPEQFCDEQASGMPTSPEQFQQMQQQMQEMNQKGQELAQENQALKGDQTIKQAEIGLKHREIDLKEQELGIKAQQGHAEMQLKARDAERADHETSVKSAESQHKMAQTDDEGERISTLEQQMAALIAMVTQVMQPQGQEDAGMDAGMDAPAAPNQEPL